MKISNEIINIVPEVENWRQELHSHPELGYEEKWTSSFVIEKLESFGIEVHKGLGKTRRGLLNQLKLVLGQGPLNEDTITEIEAILLQADIGIDATDYILSLIHI